jgi:YD repeat-containing protein
MRNLAIVMVVMVGGARGWAGPALDAKSIPLPDDAARDVCVVKRSVNASGNGEVEVASGKDGEVVHRAWWSWDLGKLKRGDLYVTNTWTAGRLTKTVDQAGETTTYAYDDRGLVTARTEGGHAYAYAWHVKPIRGTAPVQPDREDRELGLPRWLPLTGTVEVSRDGGTARTFTYDARGMLADTSCKTDTGGRQVACSYGGSKVTLRWTGAKLAGVTVEPSMDSHRWERERFSYAPDGRVTEIDVEESSDGAAWKPTQQVTLEYRCKGTFASDGDARWPR